MPHDELGTESRAFSIRSVLLSLQHTGSRQEELEEATVPLSLTLHLLLEVPQSHAHPPLRSTGHTALPVSLFPSSPDFRGHCQPHISPAAANRHRELEKSGLAQVAGAGWTLMLPQCLDRARTFLYPDKHLDSP